MASFKDTVHHRLEKIEGRAEDLVELFHPDDILGINVQALKWKKIKEMVETMNLDSRQYLRTRRDMQDELTNIERNSGALKFDLSTAVLQTNIQASAILRDEPGNLILKKMDALQMSKLGQGMGHH